jgi:hypothetical protein
MATIFGNISIYMRYKLWSKMTVTTGAVYGPWENMNNLTNTYKFARIRIITYLHCTLKLYCTESWKEVPWTVKDTLHLCEYYSNFSHCSNNLLFCNNLSPKYMHSSSKWLATLCNTSNMWRRGGGGQYFSCTAKKIKLIKCSAMIICT